MGSLEVDQIAADGTLVRDVDTTLTRAGKNQILLAHLPGARVEHYAGVDVVRYKDQVILKKQVTHLGFPWPEFKKRIQIPKSWLDAERQVRADGMVPRFLGIYHYGTVTIFVDFDPQSYVKRKANNSAAHVATNDLYQAQTSGEFSRVDRNGNRLTSIRADLFARYLNGAHEPEDPRLKVFERFNAGILNRSLIDSLSAVKEMHAASWPDTFQGEWPGFYLEYRLDNFIRNEGLADLVSFQKVKKRGSFDYDLAFRGPVDIDFYGDLKASDITRLDSPGNDEANLRRCLAEFGRFWYVVYEHETRHARANGHLATIRWNEWKRSVNYKRTRGYDPLSYSTRFKESVRFVKMFILEVNEANSGVVFGEFAQGKNSGAGHARALKVMIRKRNIDNFLIYSASALD